MVQGQPTVAEAREEHEGDSDSDEQDNAESVSLLMEHHRPGDLRDAVGKSPLCQPRQKTVTRSLGRPQKNLQEFTPTALDPSNLSPRWVQPPLVSSSDADAMPAREQILKEMWCNPSMIIFKVKMINESTVSGGGVWTLLC